MKRIYLLLILIPLASFADPNEDLFTAVKQHNLEGIKSALAAGANVNFQDATGNTALFSAIWFPDAVQLLLDAKADVNIKNKVGADALMSAATWGEAEVSSMLIKAGADVKAIANPTTIMAPGQKKPVTVAGATALSLATFMSSNANVIKLLIEAGADTKYTNSFGHNLIMIAIQAATPTEKVESVKRSVPYLEKAGLTLPEKLKNPKESNYSSVADIMTLLLDAKVNINATANTTNQTALMMAADKNRADAVQALIDAKADLNLVSSTGMQAMGYAAYSMKGEDAGLLLVAAGADIKRKDRMPLRITAKNLEKGAIHAVYDNVTILMLASHNGYPKLVEALLAAGAKEDINVIAETLGEVMGAPKGYKITNPEQTAATLAASEEFTNVVEILGKAGAMPIKDIKKKKK